MLKKNNPEVTLLVILLNFSETDLIKGIVNPNLFIVRYVYNGVIILFDYFIIKTKLLMLVLKIKSKG